MTHLSHHDMTVMFLALGILLIVARILAELAQRLGQPAVAGEILAGILLGPTLFGKIAPDLNTTLFPDKGTLTVVFHGVTTLSIVLFLLVAGMEVELSTIRRRGKLALGVSLAGFIIPFSIALLAAWLAPEVLGCERASDPRTFAVFFATAISISALPVIAKTLMDLGLYRTELGMVVISAAVCDDLAGWFIFAVILGMMGTSGTAGLGITYTILLTVLFAAFMLSGGRWLIHRILPWLHANTSWPAGVLGFAVSLALFAAALTEWIGIHAVFGAFLVGMAIGDSSHLREEIRRTILDFISFIFAPLFFASIGLRVDFVANFDWGIVFTVLGIACLGKILGCGLTARIAGMDWNRSWAVGFAMNARGAMEIILGLLALQNGLIGERLFVGLVVMALATSMMSGPAIGRLLGRQEKRGFAEYHVPKAACGHV